MRRMSSEEDQEVFEITDFTTASDWERFIARIEEIIHEWKLPLHQPQHSLKKGDITQGTWIERKEQLMFSTFQFEAIYHQLKTENEAEIKTLSDNEDEEEQIPYSLSDMMSRENDFPPKAHCLVRWYGLRDFVIIRPAKMSDAIMTQDRTKMLLSSVCIAINNTNCQVPIFVQLQQMRQKYYLGVCEGGGLRTSFEMVHQHRVFSQFSHLSGLLNLFKSKLSTSALDVPPIIVSVRFMYVLQDWSPCSWPQAPPDIDELGDDITPTDINRLPCGALEDPVLEFHLSTIWPALSSEAVIDSDIHSDLNPISAPKWTIRMRASENPNCSMAEYLKEFAILGDSSDSTNQLIVNDLSDSDEESQQISLALDKLAQPVSPVPIPSLSSILSHSKSRYVEHDTLLIGEEVLIKILQFIFPDSAPTPEEPDSDEYRDTFSSVSDLSASPCLKIQEHLRSMKCAPPGSLTWRLALAMCHVNHSYGGLPAVVQLWRDFLLEMRHRWENNYMLPCLDPGPPNMIHCLLHQKLQMLNCCIQRKKAREWQQKQRTPSVATDDTSINAQHSLRLSGSVAESDEEEFFECHQDSTSSLSSHSSSSPNSQKSGVPEGCLRQLGNLKLINSDKPLYIPITQEPAPVTEDLLEEQAEVLVQLGTHSEGAALRARMQSACLMSDMEAFKAANPNAILEDFVRWYSPRDALEEEHIDETGKQITKYTLSSRMLLPGNMWLEAWESARPVPAKRQKRLFDDTKEAERVLHFLSSIKTSDLVTSLLPMLVHCAIIQLMEEVEEIPRLLITKLEETAMKAIKVTRFPKPKYEALLRCLYQAEVIVAQLQSACTKFGLYDYDDTKNVDDNLSFGNNEKENRPKKKCALTDSSSEKLKENVNIFKFVLNLLECTEIEVPEAGKGIVGKRIRQMFANAQRASHLLVEDKSTSTASAVQEKSGQSAAITDFPTSSGKEYILRVMFPHPAPYCTPSPQRMYCVVTKDEFRLAGAFTSDTTFL